MGLLIGTVESYAFRAAINSTSHYRLLPCLEHFLSQYAVKNFIYWLTFGVNMKYDYPLELYRNCVKKWDHAGSKLRLAFVKLDWAFC